MCTLPRPLLSSVKVISLIKPQEIVHIISKIFSSVNLNIYDYNYPKPASSTQLFLPSVLSARGARNFSHRHSSYSILVSTCPAAFQVSRFQRPVLSNCNISRLVAITVTPTSVLNQQVESGKVAAGDRSRTESFPRCCLAEDAGDRRIG